MSCNKKNILRTKRDTRVQEEKNKKYKEEKIKSKKSAGHTSGCHIYLCQNA